MAEEELTLRKKTLFLLALISSCLVILFLLSPRTASTDIIPLLTIPQTAENRDLYLNPPQQDWIHDQFQKALADLNLEYNSSISWSKCGPKTYYFPKINTIFTGTPKTGCSNWIEALLRAEGTLLRDPDPTKIRMVHGPISEKHRMRKMKLEYNDTTFRRAFSFTVMRNPWTRLVSGYRDKLSDEETQGADKRSIGVRIVQEMRNISNRSIVRDQELYPTFQEFAAFLVKHQGNNNPHFSAQIETLCIPKAKYDFVVPLEYAGPLSSEVLGKINANVTLMGSYDKASDPRLQKSTIYAKEWLSKLDPEIVNKLYSIFKTDFTLLNYSNFSHPDFPLPLYSV